MAWIVDGNSYTTRRLLTIDHTKVSSTLSNFPTLVKLTGSNFTFSHTTSTGNDIRFTTSDGTTLCKFEREFHNSGASIADYWVKIPSISSSVDTTFYIYYSTNSGITDGSDAVNTWDTNFKLVWHLDSNPGAANPAIPDSLGGNAGNTINMVSGDLISGIVGSAYQFDGSTKQAQSVNAVPIHLTDYTLEAWFKQNGNPGSAARIISFFEGGTGGWNTTLRMETTGKLLGISGGTGNAGPSTNVYSDNAWHYGVMTQIVSSNVGLVVDSTDSSTAFANFAPSADIQMRLASYGAGEFFPGAIDEVRVSNIKRPAEYITATYNTVKDTFLTYGGELVFAGGTPLRSLMGIGQ